MSDEATVQIGSIMQVNRLEIEQMACAILELDWLSDVIPAGNYVTG